MSWEAWGTPDYLDAPCTVCGAAPEDCVCPECPKCGAAGDPACYAAGGHGLERTEEQIASAIRHDPEDYFPDEWSDP